MKYTFQYFVDVNTTSASMLVTQFQAGGQYCLQRIKHLLPAFKYMKLGKMSIKCIPASTLPVDPLGLSYDDDDPQTIDPRDQMNPGLVRITNGEDIYTNVSSLSADQQDAIYANMMLDPRWSKFMLQSGFKRTAVPLYWQIGQYHQDYYPGAVQNVPVTDENNALVTTATNYEYMPDTFGDGANTHYMHYGNKGYSDPRGIFQTGHKGKLGWIPTDGLVEVGTAAGVYGACVQNAMPCINCVTLILPRAHKTSYFYRIFITETVYLAGIRNTGVLDSSNNEIGELDQFVRAGMPVPSMPQTGIPIPSYVPAVKNDGDETRP